MTEHIAETVRAVPALLYGCPEGPNRTDINGWEVYEVVSIISVDEGKTCFNKSIPFPSYPMAEAFMDQVNKAAEPLHINFFDDPEFDDDLYQDIEVVQVMEEDENDDTSGNS